MVAATIGRKSEEGFRLVIAHIELRPWSGLRPNPLYEANHLSYSKTTITAASASTSGATMPAGHHGGHPC